MQILCPICSDLVHQAENIYVTKCGHIFHYHCLVRWIERSKSCPQCRNKVTDKCMFRLFPTISNEAPEVDVATIQSKLDDVQLQLRQQKSICKEHKDKIAANEIELAKNLALLKSSEEKLESRDTAIAAIKQQLVYLKIQNNETQKLKDDNEVLKKNIQTLNGLQKVLNATNDEVERMLEDYTDVRMVATFATALKRALCDSESKKNESRDRLQTFKQRLAEEKSVVADLTSKLLFMENKLSAVERKYKNLKQKRKASDALDTPCPEDSISYDSKKKKTNEDLNKNIEALDGCNISFNTYLDTIENSESPYLRLQQSSLALSALNHSVLHGKNLSYDKNLKPSEYALLNSTRNRTANKTEPINSSKTSIFQKKEPTKINFSQENEPDLNHFNISYDGMGGHSKLDTFPTPLAKTSKSCIPKLSTKHKLKRPNPVGSQDISKMLVKKLKDV